MRFIRSLLPLTLALFLLACQSQGSTPSNVHPLGSFDISLSRTPEPDPSGSLRTSSSDWYEDQNFYHIWVAAFQDSNGDGIGDIRGITSKLDYLRDLGVTALWLSPFFQNASGAANLHGYDVTDHYRVDPRFGTNDDVKELLKQAHSRGLRVIFDFVPNHVSNKHPWFQASMKGNPEKRDWFLWRPEVPESGWEDWGGNPAWRDGGVDKDGNDQYYYGLFWSGMPDLNYANPEVRQAMSDVVVYWLNQGFDGLRVDAVRFLVEDPATGQNGVTGGVVDGTITFFQNLRKTVLDPYAALGYAKFMVAENWTSSQPSLRDFIEKDGKKGFQMTLDFPFGNLAYRAVSAGSDAYSGAGGLESYWKDFSAPLEKSGGWTGTFLNNHDNYQSRPASAFTDDPGREHLAAAIQYTGLGTPFWFYGNELDMPGVNKGQDTQFRQPMEWDKLPAEQAAPGSTYHVVKDLMALRHDRISLRRGDFTPVTTSNGEVKAFLRTFGSETTLVIFNFADQKEDATLQGLPGRKAQALLTGSALSLDSGAASVKGLAPLEYRVYAVE